jgi:uncharacterized membrane protein (Fun14 family)
MSGNTTIEIDLIFSRTNWRIIHDMSGIEEMGFRIGSGALAGYVMGWSLKKIIKIVIKITAIVTGVFFIALVWMEYQKFVTIHWQEIESRTNGSLELFANQLSANNYENTAIMEVFQTLGITFGAPLGIAFFAGFMKG